MALAGIDRTNPVSTILSRMTKAHALLGFCHPVQGRLLSWTIPLCFTEGLCGVCQFSTDGSCPRLGLAGWSQTGLNFDGFKEKMIRVFDCSVFGKEASRLLEALRQGKSPVVNYAIDSAPLQLPVSGIPSPFQHTLLRGWPMMSKINFMIFRTSWMELHRQVKATFHHNSSSFSITHLLNGPIAFYLVGVYIVMPTVSACSPVPSSIFFQGEQIDFDLNQTDSDQKWNLNSLSFTKVINLLKLFY